MISWELKLFQSSFVGQSPVFGLELDLIQIFFVRAIQEVAAQLLEAMRHGNWEMAGAEKLLCAIQSDWIFDLYSSAIFQVQKIQGAFPSQLPSEANIKKHVLRLAGFSFILRSAWLWNDTEVLVP